MRSLRKFLTLSVAVMALSIVSVNAQSFSGDRHTSTRTIEQQIHNKLVNLTNYSVFDYITFQLDNGTLTLNGKVYSFGTQSEAARAVRDMPGVTRVINNIEQLPASPFDNGIRREAFRVFEERGPAQYFSTRRPEVSIIVENGSLTLEGYVRSKSESNILNILANGIPNVFRVQNNLVVGKDTSR